MLWTASLQYYHALSLADVTELARLYKLIENHRRIIAVLGKKILQIDDDIIDQDIGFFVKRSNFESGEDRHIASFADVRINICASRDGGIGWDSTEKLVYVKFASSNRVCGPDKIEFRGHNDPVESQHSEQPDAGVVL